MAKYFQNNFNTIVSKLLVITEKAHIKNLYTFQHNPKHKNISSATEKDSLYWLQLSGVILSNMNHKKRPKNSTKDWLYRPFWVSEYL